MKIKLCCWFDLCGSAMKVHPKIMVKGSHQVNQVGEKTNWRLETDVSIITVCSRWICCLSFKQLEISSSLSLLYLFIPPCLFSRCCWYPVPVFLCFSSAPLVSFTVSFPPSLIFSPTIPPHPHSFSLIFLDALHGWGRFSHFSTQELSSRTRHFWNVGLPSGNLASSARGSSLVLCQWGFSQVYRHVLVCVDTWLKLI